MPANQQQDLFIEWDLYHPQEQETMITEFQRRFGGNYTKADLLEFLKKSSKLKVAGKKPG